MKGGTKKNRFTAMINSVSPITTNTKMNLEYFLRTDLLFALLLPRLEKFEDINQKPLNFASAVGEQGSQRALNFVSVNGRELVGGSWQP